MPLLNVLICQQIAGCYVSVASSWMTLVLGTVPEAHSTCGTVVGLLLQWWWVMNERCNGSSDLHCCMISLLENNERTQSIVPTSDWLESGRYRCTLGKWFDSGLGCVLWPLGICKRKHFLVSGPFVCYGLHVSPLITCSCPEGRRRRWRDSCFPRGLQVSGYAMALLGLAKIVDLSLINVRHQVWWPYISHIPCYHSYHCYYHSEGWCWTFLR